MENHLPPPVSPRWPVNFYVPDRYGNGSQYVSLKESRLHAISHHGINQCNPSGCQKKNHHTVFHDTCHHHLRGEYARWSRIPGTPYLILPLLRLRAALGRPHEASEETLDSIQKRRLAPRPSRPLMPTPQFLFRRLQRLQQILSSVAPCCKSSAHAAPRQPATPLPRKGDTPKGFFRPWRDPLD